MSEHLSKGRLQIQFFELGEVIGEKDFGLFLDACSKN